MDDLLYHAPERRILQDEVQVLAGEVRIYEGDALIAAHPVLEGSGRRQIAAGHRRLPPPANSETPRSGAPAIPPAARPGDAVGKRPLEFYEAVGRRLAGGGHPG
jgi:hypothetical protein